MAILPTGENFALNADRYQIYIADQYGSFVLGKGLQSQEFSFDIPNEDIYEIGNEEQRGVMIKSAQFKGTLSSLLVDTDLIQLYTGKMGSTTTPADTVGTSLSGGTTLLAKVVSPVNFSSGTTSTIYTIQAVAEDKVIVSGVSNTQWGADTVITDIAGVEVVVLNSGMLTVNDKATFTVTKETAWNASDFKTAALDFMVVTRDNSTGDNVFKVDYADAMIANSFNIETSSDGMAQESFETEGNTYVSNQGYVYRKSVYANAADVVAGNIDLDARVFYGAEYAEQCDNAGKFSGHFFFKVTKTTTAGTKSKLTEKGTASVDGDFTYNATTHVFTPYTTPALGDRYEFTFYSLASGTTYTTSFAHAGTPDVVDGRYVPVNYGSTKLETVSSANINMAFNRERKTRQGYIDDYFTPAKVPVVTGEVASMDGDLKLVKLLTKGSTSTASTQFDYNEHGTYTNNNTVGLYIQIINPSDNVSEIVRFTINGVQLTGSSIPIAVGSDTGRSFSWKSKTGSCAITRG
jgi:hypothetical protein